MQRKANSGKDAVKQPLDQSTTMKVSVTLRGKAMDDEVYRALEETKRLIAARPPVSQDIPRHAVHSYADPSYQRWSQYLNSKNKNPLATAPKKLGDERSGLTHKK